MATDVLVAFPLVRQLAEGVVGSNENLQAEMESFRAMHDIIILLQAAKASTTAAGLADPIQSAQKKHLNLFCRAYGPDAVKPKHHYSLHISSQLRRDKFLLDTFVHERKHRSLKRHGGLVDNLMQYEDSVTSRLVEDALAEMPDSFADGAT